MKKLVTWRDLTTRQIAVFSPLNGCLIWAAHRANGEVSSSITPLLQSATHTHTNRKPNRKSKGRDDHRFFFFFSSQFRNYKNGTKEAVLTERAQRTEEKDAAWTILNPAGCSAICMKMVLITNYPPCWFVSLITRENKKRKPTFFFFLVPKKPLHVMNLLMEYVKENGSSREEEEQPIRNDFWRHI